jgi:energy-converting hydrogenase A subunit R
MVLPVIEVMSMEFDGLEEMMPYDGKVFISDCEGPITKNNSALEICTKFIPNGERFFHIISRYDDVLADLVRKDGYKSGDKLKLFLPFLKAFGVTDQALVDFSKKNCMMIPGADKTMRFVQEIMSPFIVSTSYEHYISAVCDHINFPFENTFNTKCSLDGVKVDDWERHTLKDLATEIVSLPIIEMPLGVRSLKDVKPEDRKAIQRLDQIFWNEMTDLASYHLIMETVPIGDSEKASAVVEVCKKVGVALEDCMYVGDGVTDIKALNIVRKGGGLAISFNGNSFAVREADVAVMSNHTIITSMLAETFYKAGKDAVLDLLDDWNYAELARSGVVHEYILKEIRRSFGPNLPEVRRVTPDKLTEIALLSSKFRKGVKGEPVGDAARSNGA